MTRIFTIVALIFLSSISFAQSFEGKVTYSNQYKSKIAKVTDESLNTQYGTIQEYFIKGGNYKSVFNGSVLKWQVYVNGNEKLYNKFAATPVILWMNSTINPDIILKTTINKKATTMLGYECDELVLECKSGIQKYYFSSKFPLNAEDFKSHAFGNWYEYLKNAKALALKQIIETPQFILTSTATEISSKQLDITVFNLPTDAVFQEIAL